MKGFKPSGYGPASGFKFPASMGFTGSTGAYTNVQPYVRRAARAFKDGGYVSQTVGDQGHALVQRSRPYTNEDQESGGKSPLRRGFKKGGKVPGPPSMKKNMNPMKAKGAPSDPIKRSPRTMKKADGGAVREDASTDLRRKTKMLAADRDFYQNSGNPKKAGAFQQMMNEQKASPALDESWRHQAHGSRRTRPPVVSVAKAKFAAADGGRVYGSSSKGFGSDMRKTGEFVGQIPRMVADALKGTMKRTQEDVADDKRRRIDSITSGTNTASNYARGGKVKRGMMSKC